MADIIDGAAVAAEIKAQVQADVAALAEGGVVPGMATALVGDDAGARLYRRQLERAAGEAGVKYRDVTMPAEAPLADVLAAVRDLAADPSVHGILPLRPFPAGVPEGAVLEALDPAKDIDCLHPINAGRLVLGQPVLYPATPWACFELLERYFRSRGIDPASAFQGKDLVIVGRSNIVGKPAYLMALQRNATVTTVHSFTWKAGTLAAHTRRADILIVAMGKAEFIKAEMVKPGAIVVDVGISVVPVLDAAGQPASDERGRPRRRTVGDVAFDEVSRVAGAITPVPGGVGAVTNLLLLRNVIQAAAAITGRPRIRREGFV
ncbi:MAG: bifunctional 5,10-methylenetetrahydrofolate dehydrogenase/5,10-methenyltetrahydrofolate cyclohydrolase [Armatimonadetes bacterium]|nr:bifunctional 5,10-methylenetetrahydrofolate dehydrogenase/5,10-methenyltetrahydrofolate cyclohydrolase [Armatimonadota bacterium]